MCIHSLLFIYLFISEGSVQTLALLPAVKLELTINSQVLPSLLHIITCVTHIKPKYILVVNHLPVVVVPFEKISINYTSVCKYHWLNCNLLYTKYFRCCIRLLLI